MEVLEAAGNPAVIETSGLTRVFGPEKVLEDVDLKVRAAACSAWSASNQSSDEFDEL